MKEVVVTDRFHCTKFSPVNAYTYMHMHVPSVKFYILHIYGRAGVVVSTVHFRPYVFKNEFEYIVWIYNTNMNI